MAEQVKTYRVLKDGMYVGDSIRHYGDLMPEAADFPNLRAYISANHLEVIWVDKSVVDDFMAGVTKMEAAKKEVAKTADPDTAGDVVSVPKKKSKKRVAIKKSTMKKGNEDVKLSERVV